MKQWYWLSMCREVGEKENRGYINGKMCADIVTTVDHECSVIDKQLLVTAANSKIRLI